MRLRLDQLDADALRNQGLLQRSPDGEEAVRVSVHTGQDLDGKDFGQRREVLKGWEQSVAASVGPLGGTLVEGQMSVLGQSTEAIVPLRRFQDLAAQLEGVADRVHIVVPRKVTLT